MSKAARERSRHYWTHYCSINYQTGQPRIRMQGQDRRGELPLQRLIILCIVIWGVAAHATTKTSYSISKTSATVTTSVEGSPRDQGPTDLFEGLAKKLKQFPHVISVEYSRGINSEKTTVTSQNFWEVKRRFPVFVHLDLSSPITVMLKVEETYHLCKSIVSGCIGEATAKVTGPLAMFDNYGSEPGFERLLQECQNIRIEVSREEGANAALKIVSRYDIDSKLIDATTDSFTRNYILLEMARVLRAGNERLALL